MTEKIVQICDKCKEQIHTYDFCVTSEGKDKIPNGTYHYGCYMSLLEEYYVDKIDVIIHRHEYYNHDRDNVVYWNYLCDIGTVEVGDIIITPDHGLITVKTIKPLYKFRKTRDGGFNGWIMGIYTPECAGRPEIRNNLRMG